MMATTSRALVFTHASETVGTKPSIESLHEAAEGLGVAEKWGNIKTIPSWPKLLQNNSLEHFL